MKKIITLLLALVLPLCAPVCALAATPDESDFLSRSATSKGLAMGSIKAVPCRLMIPTWAAPISSSTLPRPGAEGW